MKSYNCVVCVKQVPDTKKVTGDAMKADGTINRAALPAIFNPEDKCALEAALRVKETYGGTVTVITMGLPAAKAILREALMCGADRAVLVTDRKAAGSDTLATSYILSQAVKKFSPDLVFCGRQAIDGDTAQVGPQIGEKLDCAVVTYLEDLRLEGDVALKIFKLLRMTQYGRVDMMYDDVNHEFWFIEANNLPGMTNTSLLPEAAKADGVAYEDLCESLVMNCGRY